MSPRFTVPDAAITNAAITTVRDATAAVYAADKNQRAEKIRALVDVTESLDAIFFPIYGDERLREENKVFIRGALDARDASTRARMRFYMECPS